MEEYMTNENDLTQTEKNLEISCKMELLLKN